MRAFLYSQTSLQTSSLRATGDTWNFHNQLLCPDAVRGPNGSLTAEMYKYRKQIFVIVGVLQEVLPTFLNTSLDSLGNYIV